MSLNPPSNVRVSQQAKDQLVKLKRITGIKQWNVLCRWGLCVSLADPTPPLVRTIRADSNVEMSWKTFAGPLDLALATLLANRMISSDEGFESVSEVLAAHLHRGIGQLAGSMQSGDDVTSFVRLVVNAEAA